MDLSTHPRLGPIVARQAGVLRLDQLRPTLSPGEVRAQVAARRWQRVGRGVVVTSNGELHPHQRRWVALATAPPGSALSGPTAAELDGLALDHDGAVHLTIPCGARRPLSCTAEVHWSRYLDPDDVHPSREPRRTRLARSVVDWASWQAETDERRVRTIVLRSVQRRMASPAQLRFHLARRGHCRHHAVIAESIDDAEGGFGLRARARFRRRPPYERTSQAEPTSGPVAAERARVSRRRLGGVPDLR
jgi:hypothetical protein